MRSKRARPSSSRSRATRDWVLVGLVTAFLPSLPALAGPGELLAPAAGASVTTETSSIVRWSALPEDVDEFEILLSLDGGVRYPVRLTPQLDPKSGTYLWHVPNLPTPAARLRLRWGRHGHEEEGPPGEAFEIRAPCPRPLAGLRLEAGEWWITCQPCLAHPRFGPDALWSLPVPDDPVRHAAMPVQRRPHLAPAERTRFFADALASATESPACAGPHPRKPPAFPMLR